ncbi:MAG: RNA polymerase sigma factor [Armatimonadetes bacterium]|nr:RNA polymerase sigma factor [Armatimonadota bacterium]MBS1726679.1 RNA polymerase sigma factor [Armatimonadota bacterium]
MISIRRYFAQAKSEVVDPYGFIDDVYRYALARTGSKEDAEDIAIEVVQHTPKRMLAAELRPYMIGMARRKVADFHRRADRPTMVDAGVFLPAFDQSIDVHRALERLTDNHREALILKYVNGFSSAEIGSVMSLTSEAVDSLLQRARKSFVSEWNDMHGEEE